MDNIYSYIFLFSANFLKKKYYCCAKLHCKKFLKVLQLTMYNTEYYNLKLK